MLAPLFPVLSALLATLRRSPPPAEGVLPPADTPHEAARAGVKVLHSLLQIETRRGEEVLENKDASTEAGAVLLLALVVPATENAHDVARAVMDSIKPEVCLCCSQGISPLNVNQHLVGC